MRERERERQRDRDRERERKKNGKWSLIKNCYQIHNDNDNDMGPQLKAEK